MSSGLFITFEGTEGAGKSSQIQLLAGYLRESGRTVLSLREPGGTDISEEIRHLLKHSDANHRMTAETELLLMSASRAQLVHEVIRPALDQGQIVLCDRFFDSTAAYQGYGRGLDMNFIQEITRFAVGDTRPDLTLLLTVPLHVSEQRRQTRQTATAALRDRFEESDREFFQRVEQGFLELARLEPARIKVIDGTQSMEEVAREIVSHVHRRLAKLV